MLVWWDGTPRARKNRITNENTKIQDLREILAVMEPIFDVDKDVRTGVSFHSNVILVPKSSSKAEF
jgi:hypothetical protein